MKKIIMTFILVLAWLSLGKAVFASDLSPAYRIGPGDDLAISVWKNPEMSRQLAVLPDGTVHFPLVGELMVEGISVSQLKDLLVKKLDKYISDPVVSVSVTKVNSMMIYVIGKVNRPGRFPLPESIDVLQALSLAGGLNAFAKEKEIRIFRKKGTKTDIFMFNYKEVSQGISLEQNILLNRGDVIVVR